MISDKMNQIADAFFENEIVDALLNIGMLLYLAFCLIMGVVLSSALAVLVLSELLS